VSDNFRQFLIDLGSNPERAQKFATDAKALADEISKVDLSETEIKALLSRDSRRVLECLGHPKGQLLHVLDWFRGSRK
jgi:hypothetical protein